MRDRADLSRAVLDWAEAERRGLPWRRTRDPWAVLVSELMLQQTQVARVVAAYTAYIDRLPTPTACAAAPVADVIRLSAGLGYNRRALLLHRAGRKVVADHGGQVPDRLPDPDPWRRAARQTRFEGSDRQGRGRLVRALRGGPVAWANIADATGWPEERERALRVAGALVAEGLAVDGDDRLSLPL